MARSVNLRLFLFQFFLIQPEFFPGFRRCPKLNPVNVLAVSHFRLNLLYSIPNRFWICSSGTPFVSGTIVFTQRSWSTIMPQKNRKT